LGFKEIKMTHYQLQQALKLLREEGKEVRVKLNSKTCTLQAEYNRIQEETTTEETAKYQIITKDGLISLETNHESVEEFISSGVLDNCVNVERYECGSVRNFNTETLYCELPVPIEISVDRIMANPQIFAGKPIIRGRRLAVEHVLGMLAAGDTAETLLAAYPWLEREDIEACLVYQQASNQTLKL
jgi:uncharacterized protein (DUF433 family)